MYIHSFSDKFYIILIGTDDSYIEILDNLNHFNAYLQNDILFIDTINKGESMSDLIRPAKKIKKLLEAYRKI